MGLRTLDEMISILEDLVNANGMLTIVFVDGEFEIIVGNYRARDPELAVAVRSVRRGLKGFRKRCVRCGELKDLSEFPKDKNRIEGCHHTCLDCERPRWQEAKQRARALQKEATHQNGHGNGKMAVKT